MTDTLDLSHWINGERVSSERPGESLNPSNTNEIVARVPQGAAAEVDAGDDFFRQLSAHWKSHYAGWNAWLLTPDLKLPGRLRLKESRRVPMWNGPIECRLFRFDLTGRGAV